MVHDPFLLPQEKGQSEVKVEAEVGLRWSTESGWGYGLRLVKHTLHGVWLGLWAWVGKAHPTQSLAGVMGLG